MNKTMMIIYKLVIKQKESYDNLIKTNKLNKKENEVPKPPGEYEEIDEFQI